MATCARCVFVGVLLGACAFGREPNRSWDVLRQSLEPGRTVVVTRMDAAKVEGTLLELGAESITVRWHGKPEVVPRADVFRVRIANIRRRNTLIGMAIGAAAGAAIGAQSDRYRGASAAGVSLLGVGFGAIGGGVWPIGKPLYEAVKPPKPRK